MQTAKNPDSVSISSNVYWKIGRIDSSHANPNNLKPKASSLELTFGPLLHIYSSRI
jgi:hypothetical protein